MNALKSGVSWFYGWSNGPSANAKPVYGRDEHGVRAHGLGRWFNVANVVKQIPAGSKYLLGFNEPNFGASKGQSNLTAQQAASMWPQIEDIASQKQLRLSRQRSTIARGDCNQTDPFVWLDDFFAACPNCKVDYNRRALVRRHDQCARGLHHEDEEVNKPIWLTEFACADGGPYTPDQVEDVRTASDALARARTERVPLFVFSGRTDRHPEREPAGGFGRAD